MSATRTALAAAEARKGLRRQELSEYQTALTELNRAAYAAVRASVKVEGAPTSALREIAAEVDCLTDHGCSRAELTASGGAPSAPRGARSPALRAETSGETAESGLQPAPMAPAGRGRCDTGIDFKMRAEEMHRRAQKVEGRLERVMRWINAGVEHREKEAHRRRAWPLDVPHFYITEAKAEAKRGKLR